MPKNVFIRYLIVGGTAYVIEMVALYVLHYALGLSPVAAAGVSFWVGFLVAFVLQKVVTFRDYEKRPHMVAKQVGWYSLLTAWNYVFTLVMVKVLAGVLSVLVVRTIVIAITVCWNFVFYKRFFKGASAEALVE